MQVYLLRHGIAEENRIGKSDADRELTVEGRRRLRETLGTVAQAEVKPAVILASPLIRAVQTAEIAAAVLHYKDKILRTKALLPNGRVEAVWDEIRVHRDVRELMLVGHDPLFTQLAGYLLSVPELQIDFKKGAVLRVDFDAFGAAPKGILRWFLTAKLAGKSSSARNRSAAPK
jgi:phosphohistidine phosphatase